MTRQDRLRKQARHQRLQDRSVIEHLAKSFGGSQPSQAGRRIDADAGLSEQFRNRWTGGLPQFLPQRRATLDRPPAPSAGGFFFVSLDRYSRCPLAP